MMFTKEELISSTGAKVLKDNGSEKTFEISTDTRTITDKAIYLPLKGENFDGEKFIDSENIFAYFTTSNVATDRATFVLQVEDTKKAYLEIARYYREKINPITIAITGSAGKTTTKELVYSVVSQKYKTRKTFSNHNNEIGFCQTILGMEKDTEALIIEAGMRGLGEIELISKHLKPDYAIITNCGSAHIGRLGSLDNIAIAKCEITSGLNENGTFIALDQNITKKHLKFKGEKIFYSLQDVNILNKAPSYTKFEYKNNIYELNVEGEYNVENSLSAIELGFKLGLTTQQIKNGLKSYHPIEKRWEAQQICEFKFINDSYNANPESMKASVKTFIELYKNPVVILGNMGELGENEIEYHKEVGRYLSGLSKNVKYITVGSLAEEIAKELKIKGIDVKCFNSNIETARYIVENLDESNTIFLKASRAMKFEDIIENVKKRDI
ncbi:UDP-N-acetylmuramoyl-tripeptide--D-alanyl-D-alanine ligase [bacterium]|nr:UDP-N-acetylmuramoyl-tripeptide--D-alanyl-D-alanine ligase [bacterium]